MSLGELMKPGGFLHVRDCSICGDQIGYRADPVFAVIYWDGQCGCGYVSRPLGDIAPWDDVLRALEAEAGR